jgi:hypothetical protein
MSSTFRYSVGPDPGSRSAPALSVLSVLSVFEGQPEPVDIARVLVTIALARPEADRLVELGGLVEVADPVDQAGDAADLHVMLPLSGC